MPVDLVLANICSGLCGLAAGEPAGRLVRRLAAGQRKGDKDEQVLEAVATQTQLAACDFLVPSTPLRPDESARLQRLCELQALGIESGRLLDEITAVLGWIVDVPIVLVSLVTSQKLCFASRFGLQGRQAPREEHSLCAWCISPGEPSVLILPDATKDGRTCESGIVKGPPFIRFYAGCPLQTSDGYPLGTLCLIDQEPRHISRSISQLLVNLAEIVTRNIERFDLEDCEVQLPSKELPMLENKEIMQPPPEKQSFQRGLLRKERVCNSFKEAHLLVLVSPGTTKWPIIWADSRWQKLTNISVVPPSRGSIESLGDRVHFWDVATWLDECGLDKQHGGVERPDATFSEYIRDQAIFRLQVLLAAMGASSGIEAVARCVPADLPLDTNAAAIDCKLQELVGEGREDFHITDEHRLYFFVIRPCDEMKKRKLQAVSQLSACRSTAEVLQDVNLKQLIGSGSFGRVYLGEWIGSQVAVKVSQRLPNSSWPGTAFEASLSSALSHPNIVHTFEHASREISVSEPDAPLLRLLGPSYDPSGGEMRLHETMIVQEWCDRGPLSKLIEDVHPMGPSGGGLAELVAIASDIAGALAYMHARTIVHGDLSSNNVLLASRPTERGYVCKVCDFGMARAVRGEVASLLQGWQQQKDGESTLPTLLRSTTSLQGSVNTGVSEKLDGNEPGQPLQQQLLPSMKVTHPMSQDSIAAKTGETDAISTKTLGTVQYMPPEMLSISMEPRLSVKVDIFSLGVIAWQLVTGKAPWQGLSPPQVVIRVCRGKRLEFPDEAPAGVPELFSKCTEKNPEKRPEARKLLELISQLPCS